MEPIVHWTEVISQKTNTLLSPYGELLSSPFSRDSNSVFPTWMSFLILCAKSGRLEGEGTFVDSVRGTLSVHRQSCIKLLALYRDLSSLLLGSDFRRGKSWHFLIFLALFSSFWPFFHLFGSFYLFGSFLSLLPFLIFLALFLSLWPFLSFLSFGLFLSFGSFLGFYLGGALIFLAPLVSMALFYL